MTTAAYELEDRALPATLRVEKALGYLSHRAEASLAGPSLSLVRKGEAVYDAFAAAAFARRLRPDVIHFHSTNTSSLIYLTLLRLVRVPVVSTAHVVTPHERAALRDAIHRRIHRLSDLVIAHSEFDRKRLLEEAGIDAQAVGVVPHGEYGFFGRGGDLTDRQAARRSLGLAPQDEVALFFGYIREYKGLDVLLDAWPAVRRARPAARLVVAGDPGRLAPMRREELRAQADDLGVVHRFEYVPFSEVAEYFAAADLLVMPYRHISQSGVLYLALSLDVPVVTTSVGALPEVLRDGDSALLVPPESPVDLAEALIRLFADPDLRDRLVSGGQRVTSEHSWPAIAEQTENELMRIAAR
jgi:glycosyltransferase involved in cell wall biosynthesis